MTVHYSPKLERIAPCSGNCLYGDKTVHFDTMEEGNKWLQESTAQKYDNLPATQRKREGRKKIAVVKNPRIRESMKEKARTKFSVIPPEVLDQLADFLDERQEETVLVVPSGSVLYNTMIPGRQTHDYDFVVVTEPTNSGKAKQHLVGELDAILVPIDKVLDFSTRSTQMHETIYSMQYDLSLYNNQSSQWASFLKSVRLPPDRYFSLLDDVRHSFRQRFTEPVTGENKDQFRNFKHTARFNTYMIRERNENYLNPRLTEEERTKFLATLESGRMSTLTSE